MKGAGTLRRKGIPVPFKKMDFEKQAIEILRTFENNETYKLGYSGGKDSDVILHLAKKSGVRFTAVHNLTTVDAPETIKYIKNKKDVKIEYPKLSMWQLIVKHKSPPTRLFRYCCKELKERSGTGSKLITGVRKDNMVLEHTYQMSGKNFNQRNTVHGEDTVCRTLISSSHAGNEPKVLIRKDFITYRIRKLTPRECGRLMDVSDEDISKMESVNSNSQLYKQFGNSIVKRCMVAMFSNLNIQGLPRWDAIKDKY